MAKVYVAKVNLISNISSIYEKNGKDNVVNKVYQLLEDDISFVYTYQKSVSGKQQSFNENYTLTINEKSEEHRQIKGVVAKEAVIHYKTKDKLTKNVRKHNPEVIEEIEFLYDVPKERIAFTTKSRFKYKQFIIGMAGIINKCMEMHSEPYSFELSIYRTGLSVEIIKDELSKLGKICELSISYQLPNPDEAEYEEMVNNPEKFIDKMSEAGIDNMSHIFKSSQGVNINSEVIDKQLNVAKNMHSSLRQEKVFSNGYAKVTATNDKGIRYSTENSNIFVRNMTSKAQKFDFFKETIHMTIEEIIDAEEI